MFDPRKKTVFIMSGFPGSGKSTLAKKLAEKFGCDYLSSDQLRAELTNQAHYEQSGKKAVSTARHSTYELLYNRAAELVSSGKKVVLDATHVEPDKWRQPSEALFENLDMKKACIVMVKTPFEVVDQRMLKFNSELANETETVYEAWRRVYSYFVDQERRGLVVWPDTILPLESVTSDEISIFLD